MLGLGLGVHPARSGLRFDAYSESIARLTTIWHFEHRYYGRRSNDITRVKYACLQCRIQHTCCNNFLRYYIKLMEIKRDNPYALPNYLVQAHLKSLTISEEVQRANGVKYSPDCADVGPVRLFLVLPLHRFHKPAVALTLRVIQEQSSPGSKPHERVEGTASEYTKKLLQKNIH